MFCCAVVMFVMWETLPIYYSLYADSHTFSYLSRKISQNLSKENIGKLLGKIRVQSKQRFLQFEQNVKSSVR